MYKLNLMYNEKSIHRNRTTAFLVQSDPDGQFWTFIQAKDIIPNFVEYVS